MGRPRQFDEDETLQAALMVFRRHGYEGTTYKLLERATGVRGRSLINAFGDKDALFLRALRHYRATVEGIIARVFATPGRTAIEATFDALASATDDPEDIANAGCLMVNTVFELGRTRAAVREEVDAYRELWRSTFERALVADGVADAPARAEFLVGTLWGALAQIRLAGRTESVAPLAAITVDTVRGWPRAARDV